MPAKKSPSTAPKKPAKAAGARTTARPAAKKASASRPAGGAAAAGKATRPTVVALRPDDARTEVAAPEGGSDRAPGFTLPLIGWRVTAPTLPALPTMPDEITLPVVGWTVNANEREAIAYYAVLGGLVAIEVVEWPLAALFVAGHVLARHTHYKGLEGAVEALEEA